MFSYQVNITSQQFFKILSSGHHVISFWGHFHKNIHITVLLMLIFCHRSKQPHISNAELLLKHVRVGLQYRYILLLRFHTTKKYVAKLRIHFHFTKFFH